MIKRGFCGAVVLALLLMCCAGAVCAEELTLTPAENSCYTVSVPGDMTLIFVGYTANGQMDFVRLVQAAGEDGAQSVLSFSVPRSYGGTMKLLALGADGSPLSVQTVTEPPIVTPKF